jgi:biopolymer transport protein ExbB/TolQ
MMDHNQLNLLPPETIAILIRKKRFWKRTMILSFTIASVAVVIYLGGTVLNMMRAFSTLEASGGADPAKLAGDISGAILTTLYSLPIAGLGFLIAIIALIRFLSLPKIPGTKLEA